MGFGSMNYFSGRSVFDMPQMNIDLLTSRIEMSLSQWIESKAVSDVSTDEAVEVESLFNFVPNGFDGLRGLGSSSVGDYLGSSWDWSPNIDDNFATRPAVVSREMVSKVDLSGVDKLVQAMATFDRNMDGVLDHNDFRAANDYGDRMILTASSLM